MLNILGSQVFDKLLFDLTCHTTSKLLKHNYDFPVISYMEHINQFFCSQHNSKMLLCGSKVLLVPHLLKISQNCYTPI
jgi:hypothetical protein